MGLGEEGIGASYLFSNQGQFFFSFLVMHCFLDLSSLTRAWAHAPPAVEAWSPNHWTTREVPLFLYLKNCGWDTHKLCSRLFHWFLHDLAAEQQCFCENASTTLLYLHSFMVKFGIGECESLSLFFLFMIVLLMWNPETPHEFLSFFWPHHEACRILAPGPGIEPMPSAVEAWSPNHWTTREVLRFHMNFRRVFSISENLFGILTGIAANL